MTLKELKNLPVRKWDDVKSYNSILLVRSGKKHPSGWAKIYVVGLDNKLNPVEIAAVCDDITWYVPNSVEYDFRTDMFYKNGCVHFWSNKFKFKVGPSLSSTEIYLEAK